MVPRATEIALRTEKLSKVYRSGESDLVVFEGVDLEHWR